MRTLLLYRHAGVVCRAILPDGLDSEHAALGTSQFVIMHAKLRRGFSSVLTRTYGCRRAWYSFLHYMCNLCAPWDGGPPSTYGRDGRGDGERERLLRLSLCFLSFFECFFSFFLSLLFRSRLCFRSLLDDELDDESESELDESERDRLRCFLSFLCFFLSFLSRVFSFLAFRSSSSWNSLIESVRVCSAPRELAP